MRIFGRKATGLVLLGLIAGIGVLGSSLGQGVEGRAQPGPVLRAGAATSNITPSIGGEIVGGFVPFPSTHIHDELLVRCLVLDNGRTRIAFAVSDNVGISRYVFDAAKRMVNAETGIPVENLLMSANHTHSAVSARGKSYLRLEGELDEYQKFLSRRIADGIRRAVNNLEPARIGWAVGSEASQVFNRRYRMKPGVTSLSPYGEKDEVRMNPGVGNPNVSNRPVRWIPKLPFFRCRRRTAVRLRFWPITHSITSVESATGTFQQTTMGCLHQRSNASWRREIRILPSWR